MTEFEILDDEDIVFKAPAQKTTKPQKALKQPVVRVNSHRIKPASQRSVSYSEDYTKPAGQPRIYEVVIETVDYNKSGTKINYSHTIKYPGHEEFFADE
jgi:hypothetical protein